MKSIWLLTLLLPIVLGLDSKGLTGDKNILCQCKIECPKYKCIEGAELYMDPIKPCSCDNCPFCAIINIGPLGFCNYIPGSGIKTEGIRRICRDDLTCQNGTCIPKWVCAS